MIPIRIRVTVMLGVILGAAGAKAQEPEWPIYVGRTVCRSCHPAGHAGVSCALRPIPKHADAFDALTHTEAKHIAALSGLTRPPRQSRVCLSCHAAAADEGPRWTAATFHIEDGVQCESCHGPGSRHVAIYRSDNPRRDPLQRRDRVGAAVRTTKPDHNHREGGPSTPRRSSGLRRGAWRTCLPCHVEKPSHEEVLERGFRLKPEDRKYKTPVNLAIAPDGLRLYVVCQQSDSLIVVDAGTGGVLHEIRVGRRPHGVAVAPDGRTVYVTNRMSDSLTQIDPQTAKVTRAIPVGHEPHGVILDLPGRLAFVANTGEDTISVIDLEQGREAKRLVAGRGPWSCALTSDGRFCYVTSVRPNLGAFRQPPRSEVTVVDVLNGIVSSRPVVDGANMLQGVAAGVGADVMLATMMRTKNLVPITRIAQGWVITNGLCILHPDGRVGQVLLDEPAAAFPDPMDVAVRPDGQQAVVVSGGADRIAVVDVAKLRETLDAASDGRGVSVLANHLGASAEFVVKRAAVGTNPRSVVFSPDGRFVYVANALDDSITVLDASDYHVVRTISLGGPSGITEVRLGERLFHSARRTWARQFSCRSCHPDGHINGLTFDISADGIGMHPVDNRTLRGVFDTPPFKWEGTNPTLDRQCGARLAVFFTRLPPYTPRELTALVRYMGTIEQPANRFRRADGLTPAQRRGKAVFERTVRNDGKPIVREQRCSYCHSGAYLTNRTTANVATTMWFDAPAGVELIDENLYATNEFGALGNYYFIDVAVKQKEFDVPHLRNIDDSAPYLHNGAAATLEEIWTRFNIFGRHGVTEDLTRQQFNDLIAYLKSL